MRSYLLLAPKCVQRGNKILDKPGIMKEYFAEVYKLTTSPITRQI
jgi:hypothetical protein